MVHYSRGRNSATIKEDAHQQICKAIARGGNADSTIVGILRKHNSMVLVQGSRKIVLEECKTVSKRGSGTLFQKKTHADFCQLTVREYLPTTADDVFSIFIYNNSYCLRQLIVV